MLYEIGKEAHRKPNLSATFEREETSGEHDTIHLADNSFKDILSLPTTLLVDNRASNLWGTESISSKANQCIRTSYALRIRREAINKNFITIEYIPTRLNLSDAMKKALDKCTFERLVPVILGYIEIDSLREEADFGVKTTTDVEARGRKSGEIEKEE